MSVLNISLVVTNSVQILLEVIIVPVLLDSYCLVIIELVKVIECCSNVLVKYCNTLVTYCLTVFLHSVF